MIDPNSLTDMAFRGNEKFHKHGRARVPGENMLSQTASILGCFSAQIIMAVPGWFSYISRPSWD
jgi:hypothetical protein